MSETPDFKDRDAFDESDRELCPDGNCTGLIGSDGRCKVCGLALADNRRRPASEEPGDDSRSAPARDVAPDSEADDDLAVGGMAIDDAEDRQLCPDGNCIGLIGSDGKCKVCGRPAAS
jgi:hypothetical protein